jgi:hypothetical protein
MAISEILESIDLNIAKLQQARTLLAGGVVTAPTKSVGRPKKVVAVATKSATAVPSTTKPARKKKRNLSPAGRKRIADAAKKRWAAKRSSGKK